MTIDLTIVEDVKQLRRAGPRPVERLVRDILRAGDATYRPLLELASDVEQLHADAPACYGPIHGLRLLGEMPRVEMIAPLLGLLPITRAYVDERLPEIWLMDMPQILVRVGAAAVAPLWAIADDEEQGTPTRTAALVALGYAAEVAPDARDAIIAGLRERLSASDNPMLNAYLITALGELRVPDVYAEVMQKYRDGKVVQDVIGAGTARQLLLTERAEKKSCANHPLWERYDHHPLDAAKEGKV